MAADLERMMADLAIHAREVADVLGRDHLDPRVLEALRRVPRDRFVDPKIRKRAFADHPLSIGHGQTISQPFIVALMSDLLGLEAHHKVLEIGTGSGYQAAVLAELAGTVHGVEIIKELVEQAKANLQPFGYKNLFLHHGDGHRGLPNEAPFDRIMAAAAAPDVPSAWLDQLSLGGRLLMPVGKHHDFQNLMLIEKDLAGQLSERATIPVAFVPLTGRI